MSEPEVASQPCDDDNDAIPSDQIEIDPAPIDLHSDNSSVLSFDLSDSESEMYDTDASMPLLTALTTISRADSNHRDVTAAYHGSRTTDQENQRNIQLDKAQRFNVDQLRQPLHDKHNIQEVQKVSFLASPQMRPDDPYYGFERLGGGGGTAERSPDSVPEEYSAHFPPRLPGPQQSASSKETIHGAPIKNSLRLIANFSSVAPGFYNLYLKTKQTNEEVVAARLATRVLVRYPATGTHRHSYTRFIKSPRDVYTDWRYLRAENPFEVYPHVGSAEVNINIVVVSDDVLDGHCSQLLIRSLEIVPTGVKSLHPVPVIPRFSTADYSVDVYQESDYQDPVDLQHSTEKEQLYRNPLGGEDSLKVEGVITRLVVSKNGDFVAALTTFPDHFKVQIWHKEELKKEADSDSVNVSRLGFSSALIPCQGARSLPLELAISATGGHLAVFEAPKIGDWLEDTVAPKSNIGVRLFRSSFSKNRQIYIPVEGDEVSLNTQDVPTSLKQAVGYAAFVGEFTTGAHTTQARLVFCNGLYIDVYELHTESLTLSNTIPLTNMKSALWRTNACDLMMRSIATDMFIWVEENGRCCSTWDLSNGSAIGRIEVAGLQSAGASGVSTMSVASNQNIIAIVGGDNSITTIDASSGIVISRRVFFNHIVENIEFASTQSQMLLAMVREEGENQQTVLILDPLRLNIQEHAQFAPPFSSSAAFGLFGAKSWPEIGVVCQPDSQLIQMYEFKKPFVAAVRSMGLSPNASMYELRTTVPTSLQGSGEGCESQLKRQVEVWRKGGSGKRVFSFIPEPWEQHKAVDGMILPTGDRFVVYASWTIQLWSLPTTDEPRCRLLFFWSMPGHHQKATAKTELEIVLGYHTCFNAVAIHEFLADGQIQFQASVVSADGLVRQVPMPNSPVQYSDSLIISKDCIQSIWLIALAHTIVSSESQDLFIMDQHTGRNEEHASAIIDFVNIHMNHAIHLDETSERTVLTNLLNSLSVTELNSKFTAALLENDRCSWISCFAKKADPIAAAVARKNTKAACTMLDYCARKALTSHPAYVAPVEQSLSALAKYYPELVQDFFRKTSFIPAKTVDFSTKYVATSAVGWSHSLNMLFSWLSWGKQRHDEQYLGRDGHIFSFQLKKRRGAIFARRNILSKRSAALLQPLQLQYDCNVYTVPFPSLITLGSGSQFDLLAGKSYFDSPALMAILRYKTWQYGLLYWIYRYVWLLVFYGAFLAITCAQLSSSKALDAPAQPLSLYLGSNWLAIPIVGIAAGCYLIIMEILQLVLFGPGRYFRSLYNYIELTSIILASTCLGEAIHVLWHQESGGYRQFAVTPFAIVAMYLHLISETRIYRPIGVIVNTIVLVFQKIRAFLLVFGLIVIGFAHSLIYLQYVYHTECNSSGVCTQPYSHQPLNVLSSFSTTLFFMSGRFDSIDEPFLRQDPSFLLLITIFYIFLAIFLLTALIAHASDAFHEAHVHGEQAMRIQLSEALAEAELMGRFLATMEQWIPPLRAVAGFLRKYSPLSWRRARHSPSFIYYVARFQDVEAYRARICQ